MKLYETINAGNWGKADSGKRCLLAHIAALYPGRGDEWVHGPELKAVKDAIRLLYSERGNWSYPAFFNDHADTTLEDVIRVLKVADV